MTPRLRRPGPGIAGILDPLHMHGAVPLAHMRFAALVIEQLAKSPASRRSAIPRRIMRRGTRGRASPRHQMMSRSICVAGRVLNAADHDLLDERRNDGMSGTLRRIPPKRCTVPQTADELGE